MDFTGKEKRDILRAPRPLPAPPKPPLGELAGQSRTMLESILSQFRRELLSDQTGLPGTWTGLLARRRAGRAENLPHENHENSSNRHSGRCLRHHAAHSARTAGPHGDRLPLLHPVTVLFERSSRRTTPGPRSANQPRTSDIAGRKRLLDDGEKPTEERTLFPLPFLLPDLSIPTEHTRPVKYLSNAE